MKNLTLISLLALATYACSPTKIKEVNPVESVKNVPSVAGRKATVITTAKDTDLRLTESAVEEFAMGHQPLETENSIFVNPFKSFQTFIGIGGAISDASAETFDKLSPEKQDELIKAYYSEDGISYSLLRTHIHSCDFSRGNYTYIDEGDKSLESFSVETDLQHKIPMMKRAIASSGGELMTYVSPWSPPAFMKSNNNMLQGGKLLPEYYDAWAMYLSLIHI